MILQVAKRIASIRFDFFFTFCPISATMRITIAQSKNNGYFAF